MTCPRCGASDVSSTVCSGCGNVLGVPASSNPRSRLDEPTTPTPSGPLADFALMGASVDAALAAAPSPELTVSDGAVRSELPLFPAGASVGPAPPPRRGRSPSRRTSARPLGVRRQTPPVPRLRPRREPQTTRSMALEFEDPGEAASNRLGSGGAGLASASLARRFGAAVVDLGIVGVIDVGVLVLTTRLAGLSMEYASVLPLAPLVGFLALLNGGYVVALTALGGQTIGKMMFGIRVVGKDGVPASFREALVRSAASVVSVLPLGLGFVGALFGDGRALHDVAAETNVVRQ